MSLIAKIDDLSAQRKARRGWTYAVILVFLLLVIIPSLYVVIAVTWHWDGISKILGDGSQMAQIWNAIGLSFSIALIVTVIDIIIGLPMAWIMVRKEFKGKHILDTLIDLPLAFPTAVLGLSVVMFWGCPQGVAVPGLGLVLSPYLMLILLHIIFTYPYMVRSLSGILEQIDVNYETAAMTLGASRFTAIRTITLPLFRSGLVTGFILCFARSLSETGGTDIALSMMQAAGWYTGPTLICAEGMSRESQILISVLMIAIAFVLLFIIKEFMKKINLPWSKVFPMMGRRISRGGAAKTTNALSMIILFILVLIPAFYLFAYVTVGKPNMDWGQVMGATMTSFAIAGIAVLFDTAFGIPMALYIVRHSDSKLSKLMDSMINIPLIVPTAALGVSLSMFWEELSIAGLIVVVFGHIAFTYPLMVRNIIGALEEVDVSYEEVSMTLGAKPFQAFRKILMPIIKPSVIAGGILVFTRSLGETGATVAADPSLVTIPVLIMKWADPEVGNYTSAAFAAMFLVIVCFVLLMAVRMLTKAKGDADA